MQQTFEIKGIKMKVVAIENDDGRATERDIRMGKERLEQVNTSGVHDRGLLVTK